MKKVITMLLAMLTLFLLVGCSNSESVNTSGETKKEKMADKAEELFEASDAFNGQFTVGGIGNFKKCNAHLMYNDDDDSYKFSLRNQGHEEPLVTFYLAKAEVPDTDRYIYAYVVTSSNNFIFKQIKDDKEIMLIGSGLDNRITMSEIEDNFNMSESNEFTLEA